MSRLTQRVRTSDDARRLIDAVTATLRETGLTRVGDHLATRVFGPNNRGQHPMGTLATETGPELVFTAAGERMMRSLLAATVMTGPDRLRERACFQAIEAAGFPGEALVSVDLRLSGQDVVLRNLQAIAEGMPSVLGSAIRTEAELEMAEAKQRTPVDLGALRSSGTVSDPTVDGHDVSVELTFGGPSAPYAVYIHEDLEAIHPVGQAKFLESVLLESAPYLGERIGRRIDLGTLVR